MTPTASDPESAKEWERSTTRLQVPGDRLFRDLPSISPEDLLPGTILLKGPHPTDRTRRTATVDWVSQIREAVRKFPTNAIRPSQYLLQQVNPTKFREGSPATTHSSIWVRNASNPSDGVFIVHSRIPRVSAGRITRGTYVAYVPKDPDVAAAAATIARQWSIGKEDPIGYSEQRSVLAGVQAYLVDPTDPSFRETTEALLAKANSTTPRFGPNGESVDTFCTEFVTDVINCAAVVSGKSRMFDFPGYLATPLILHDAVVRNPDLKAVGIFRIGK
jgi:hypothetical protein